MAFEGKKIRLASSQGDALFIQPHAASAVRRARGKKKEERKKKKKTHQTTS